MFIIWFILSILLPPVMLSYEEECPWDDFYPYWGERPGEQSHSLYHQYNGTEFPVHILINAEDWVNHHIQEGGYEKSEPNEVELSLLSLHPKRSYTIWRSLRRVDMGPSPTYQASEPTFIVFDDGVCIFYMYNFYIMCSLDAIPPPCEGMERRFE